MAEILKFSNTKESELEVYFDLLSKKKYYEAFKLLENSQFANDEELLTELALLHDEQNNWSLCIKKCFQILEQNEDNYLAYYLIADCLYKMSMPEGGTNILQKAMSLSEKFYDSAVDNENSDKLLDKFEDTMSYVRDKFEDIITEELDEESGKVFSILLKAEELFSKGKGSDEIAFLESCGYLDNQMVAMHYIGCLVENAEFQKALNFCLSAMETFKENTPFLIDLIFLENMLGKEERPFEILNQLKDITLTDSEQNHLLNTAKATRNDMIVLCASEIVEAQNPLNIYALNLSILANYNLGNFEVSLKKLDKLESFGDDFSYAYFLKDFASKEKNHKTKLRYSSVTTKEDKEKQMKKMSKYFSPSTKWTKKADQLFCLMFSLENNSFENLPLDRYLQNRTNDNFVKRVLCDSYIDDLEKLTLVEALYFSQNKKDYFAYLYNNISKISFSYPDNFEECSATLQSIYAIAATIVCIANPTSLRRLAICFEIYSPIIEHERITALQEKYYAIILILKADIDGLKTADDIANYIDFSKQVFKKYEENFFPDFEDFN